MLKQSMGRVINLGRHMDMLDHIGCLDTRSMSTARNDAS